MRIQWRAKLALIFTLTLAVTGCSAFAAVDSIDSTAKFLAGLTVPATAVDAIEASPWIVHSRELDRAWKRTEQQQLPAIARWAPDFIGPAYGDTGTMFYMFSGPDFLYAQAFFANARTYILCGTEPVGAVPDLNAIPPDALTAALGNLRKSLESVLSFNFFITKDMKADLTRTQLNGTIPLLYVFLARTGYTIDSVEPIRLDSAGNINPEATNGTPGVRISIHRSPDFSQTLYYFCTDLSDDGIKSNPGFLRFCETQGRAVSLLKAASYLMHDGGFSRVREFLLHQSDVIVQDDSGIPLRYFDDPNWTIRFCGHYAGPINIFKQHWQPELAEVYGRVTPAPLPFSFGYQWQPNRSDLMIAARDGTANSAIASRADMSSTRLRYAATEPLVLPSEPEVVAPKPEYRKPPPVIRRGSKLDPSKTKDRLIPRM